MKIAIISDIHGNSEALKATLKDNLSLKVNSRFCLKLEFSLGMKFYLSRI